MAHEFNYKMLKQLEDGLFNKVFNRLKELNEYGGNSFLKFEIKQ